VVFADLWSAETAWLLRLASGLGPPWWEDAIGARPAGAASVILGWIERDPGRAAAALLDLLAAAPNLPLLLEPADARRLAARLLARVRIATRKTLGADADEGAGDGMVTGLAPAPPSAIGAVLDEIDPDRRSLFVVAVYMVHRPSWTPGLVVSDAAALTSTAGRAAPDSATSFPGLARTAQPDGDVHPNPGQIARESAASASAIADGEPSLQPTSQPAVGAQVINAGLLLLLRPLAASGMLTGLRGDGLADALQALGLAALRRVTAAAPDGARHAVLERDRPLLTVFAGRPPPVASLANLALPPQADQQLDELIARAPAGVGWAQGALRRGYGGELLPGDALDGLLARILVRPARLAWTRWSADVTWPLESADLALRRAGWDIDPGWLPWIGRTIRFHYHGIEEP
jgi:hypothetical protein